MGPGWGPRERRPQETKSLGLLAASVPDQWVCHGFLPSQLIETSMGKKDPWRFEGRGLGEAQGKERSAEAVTPGKSSQTGRQVTASPQVFEKLHFRAQSSIQLVTTQVSLGFALTKSQKSYRAILRTQVLIQFENPQGY